MKDNELIKETVNKFFNGLILATIHNKENNRSAVFSDLDTCVKHSQMTWASKKQYNYLAVLSQKYGECQVVNVDIVTEISNCCKIVKIELDNDILLKAKLIKEKAPYQPDINGTWGVNPVSITLF